ncbi:MAG: peptidylprolyl isomerase [Deltaproteobacteria bacterium]
MNKQIKLLLAYSAFFILAAPLPGLAEVVDRIVAVVNSDLITLSELEDAEGSLVSKSKKRLSEEERKLILDQLIEQKLLEQEAKKQGFFVTDAEVETTIQGIQNRFGLNEAEMAKTLKKQNLTMEGFRDQWRRQLLMNKIISNRVKGQIVVTEDEVKNYYDENSATIETIEEFRVSHIVIAITAQTPEAEARGEKLALAVLRLAESGRDFKQLAKQYSKDDSSAQNGGDLGYFKKGDMAPELEKALIGTPVGDVVGPVRTAAGYHVLKVTDKKKAQAPSLEIAREQIRDAIYQEKLEKIIGSFLDDVKKTAYIEIKL